MQLKIEITDPKAPLAIMVARTSDVWPDLLHAFIGAIIAAQFVTGRVAVYDEAITSLTAARDAIKDYAE